VRHHRSVRQRLFVFASWAVTTMVATLVSAAGVSIVTSDVTDDHNPALGRADVVALLSAPQPTPAPTVSVTVPPSTTETTLPPPPTTVVQTLATTAPTLPPPATAPPTTRPPTRLPLLGGAVSAMFSVDGGTMTVACLGDQIALVSARPNDGYQLVVYVENTERVGVGFTRDGSDYRDQLESECSSGEPVLATGHDPRRDGDGGDRDGRDHDGRSGGDGSGDSSGSGSGLTDGWGFGG
jgi:hypothetical protein